MDSVPRSELSREWDRMPVDPFAGPPELESATPPPNPTPPTPNPLPGGARRPTRIMSPTPDRSPSDQLIAPPADPAEGAPAPPAPASAPEDPSAYYPVGKNRGPMASLWKRVSDFSPLGKKSESTAPAQLVSHESADAEEAPRTAGWKAALSRFSNPLRFGQRD
ncbi:hypothetical protein LzC2_10830 [Planctomycetes bacterium LzC2]|uniref:Uncharacterized protein n=2 Tax=Alienimonas chondri TaxID=2681879 RepID=A0ABX1VD95_9PLAN|nr:hypothetical protein [Alienimonas chondri]